MAVIKRLNLFIDRHSTLTQLLLALACFSVYWIFHVRYSVMPETGLDPSWRMAVLKAIADHTDFVDMDIVDMLCIIPIIADCVLPLPAIPYVRIVVADRNGQWSPNSEVMLQVTYLSLLNTMKYQHLLASLTSVQFD